MTKRQEDPDDDGLPPEQTHERTIPACLCVGSRMVVLTDAAEEVVHRKQSRIASGTGIKLLARFGPLLAKVELAVLQLDRALLAIDQEPPPIVRHTGRRDPRVRVADLLILPVVQRQAVVVHDIAPRRVETPRLPAEARSLLGDRLEHLVEQVELVHRLLADGVARLLAVEEPSPVVRQVAGVVTVAAHEDRLADYPVVDRLDG